MYRILLLNAADENAVAQNPICLLIFPFDIALCNKDVKQQRILKLAIGQQKFIKWNYLKKYKNAMRSFASFEKRKYSIKTNKSADANITTKFIKDNKIDVNVYK